MARDLFRFGPLHAGDLALTLAGAALVLGVLEWAKPYSRARLAS